MIAVGASEADGDADEPGRNEADGATVDAPQATTRATTASTNEILRLMAAGRSLPTSGSRARPKSPTAGPDGDDRLVRGPDDRSILPILASRREDVDHDSTLGACRDLVRRVADDPPGAARTETSGFVSDAERDFAFEDNAALLVRVAMLRYDRIGPELDDRKREPLALDPPGDDVVPDPEGRKIGEIDEIRHASSELATTSNDRRPASLTDV